jgi:predicted GTPase
MDYLDTENNGKTLGTFIDYNKTLMSLIVDINQLREFSHKLKLDKSIQLIDEVLERIEKNSFSIAVVGEFKRGKSTFINALLGQDILPSDIIPTTATLNRVTYGIKPLVKVFFKDGREEEVAIDRLTDYVTKLTVESEETAANVKEAVVYYPVHYCQNNVDIIDTPGLNDEANMTEVTLSVLPQVDAAIMVVMAQAPFSEYEREFLETKLLSNDLGRIIFVVTGIDRYNNPQDADRGIKYIKDRISKHVLQRALEQYGKDSPEFEVYKKKIARQKCSDFLLTKL